VDDRQSVAGAPGHALGQALGGEDLRWLRERVRDRLRRGRPLTGTVTLQAPARAQVAAAGGLLGRSLRGRAGLQVRLEEVSEALARAGLAADVGEAVQRLDGPVSDESARRLEVERAWAGVHELLAESVLARPALAPWVEDLRRTGLLRRLAADPGDGPALAEHALAVVSRLPAPGVRRERLAAEALGGAHALDDGRPVATLVLGAAQALAGVPALDGAEGRRETWAAVGVLVDDLLSRVLVLNLPAVGSGFCDRLLRAGGEAGEPVVLTLGALVRHAPSMAGLVGAPVFVCENVTVVAEAADHLGVSSHPLVCVGGQPSDAALRLLSLLAGAGADLRYHGDFDWAGVAIANRVVRRTGASPWRFGAVDYAACAGAAPGDGSALRGTAVVACWDPGLRAAMESCGVAVEEEHVLATLLADLASPSGG
jgi:uncharacterized protein (TIGR02679 family)